MTSASGLSAIRIVALGGLGEIGMNCLCVEVDGRIIVIDCGISFPHSDLGIDVFHPDFSYLEERRERVVGVVLTHAHEDHIGGIPFLLRIADVPIFGSRHALAMVGERLADRGVEHRHVRLKQFTIGKRFDVGPFSIEPVRVSHSIPEACALVLRYDCATIVHSGDFKFDPDPPDGCRTDEARLEAIGDQGVDLLLSDSTNIDAEGMSGSERTVGRALDEAIVGCETRVVVGMFSSNVHRLMLLGDIAMQSGRKITLLGRSAQTHTRVAVQCSLLDWPSDLVVPPELVGTLEPRRSLIIAGGTQGESFGALCRLATRSHQAVVLAPDDLLLLSSRIIPGNDPAVLGMVSNFHRQRVRVENRSSNPALHVSGHAHRAELQRMIDLLRPKAFLPIHGTLHHLHGHAKLARSMGVQNVMIGENGDIFELGAKGLRRYGVAEVGKVATFYGEEISENAIKQRELLGRHGVAFLVLLVDSRGVLARTPVLRFMGAPDDFADAEVQRNVLDHVAKAFSRKPFTTEYPTDHQVVEVAERAIQRGIEVLTSQRPMIVVQVIRA